MNVNFYAMHRHDPLLLKRLRKTTKWGCCACGKRAAWLVIVDNWLSWIAGFRFWESGRTKIGACDDCLDEVMDLFDVERN